MSPRAAVRLLAGLCAILALICVGLAVAYHRKAEQVTCLRDADEIGLAGGGCP